jgi:hypothetical protein
MTHELVGMTCFSVRGTLMSLRITEDLRTSRWFTQPVSLPLSIAFFLIYCLSSFPVWWRASWFNFKIQSWIHYVFVDRVIVCWWAITNGCPLPNLLGMTEPFSAHGYFRFPLPPAVKKGSSSQRGQFSRNNNTSWNVIWFFASKDGIINPIHIFLYHNSLCVTSTPIWR